MRHFVGRHQLLLLSLTKRFTSAGGDEISHNLVFSSCRESGDHGPFNSWDRQPFLTTVRTGKPDMTMKEREIHHNFCESYGPLLPASPPPSPQTPARVLTYPGKKNGKFR